MNTPSSAMNGSSQGIAGAVFSAARPFYWSMRRELWENRLIYIAPLAAAVIFLFGFVISMLNLRHRMHGVWPANTALHPDVLPIPHELSGAMIMGVALVVGIFYSLDALYGERRDRSILFWKSLPVSDRTSLLSKATIPLIVLPLVTFAIVVVTHLIMMLWTSVLLLTHGMSPASTWTYVPLFRNSFVLLYGLAAIALWHAPIYGWALLVSGWARRATFLWAILPFFAIAFFEKITFGTSHFASMLKERLMGFAPTAFSFNMHSVDCPRLTPGTYLSSPALWLGLIVAAVFIGLAIRLRRYRGPL